MYVGVIHITLSTVVRTHNIIITSRVDRQSGWVTLLQKYHIRRRRKDKENGSDGL